MLRSLLAAILVSSQLLAAPDGATLYKTQCAGCHGHSGQGTKKKYAKPLVGDLSTAQLAELVRKTMPEDAPESLSKEDAAAIATWMHGEFYSSVARERFKPARVELVRLTVPQYRNSAADLIGSFPWAGAVWSERGKGLKGEYFGNRSYGNRIQERIDPIVKFDFDTKPPTDGKYDENEFSIRWSGSVLAPETGDYTFTVKSDQAVRLWVNNDQIPIVDANVKSGNQTEYPVNVFLVGGRVYYLKLEMSKALQGVKDKMPKPVKAFCSLNWKAPHGVTEPIPTRLLSPVGMPEQFIANTPFPPDDKSLGWERGSNVSKEWDSAATESALEAAAYVQKHLLKMAEIDPKAAKEKRPERVKKFAEQFVERAFRRPLTPEQKELYIERQFVTGNGDLEATIQRIVLLALKSPRFLYREIAPNTDAFDTASRLSFALWDSLPDNELRNAAAQGKLSKPEEVRSHAERMLKDPRAEAKLRGFLFHWLRLDQEKDLGKNAKLFPAFDGAARADLRTSLELFLNEVLQSPEADFRKLLKSDEIYLNARLGKIYGNDVPAEAGFQKVKLDADKRAGVLTHPYLMTTFAYSEHSSPIHRGVFLAKGILGTGLKPPADAFSPFEAGAHPTLNTRERVALQTQGVNCQTCHSIINPLGFALESFDAIGKYREMDNAKPVNSHGSYLTRTGEIKTFTGAADLAKFLVDSPEVHAAFVEQLFHHLVQQPVRAYGPNRGEELRSGFQKSSYNIRKLAADIAVTSAMNGRR